MTQETEQPEKERIGALVEKLKSATEIADESKVEVEKPAQINFKVKGTIDYDIEYEGDNLKIISTNSDEAAMIYLFQTRMRIEAAKANMYKKEYKNQYTAIDRQDINASLRVLNKLVESIGQRVYQNIRINNMTPEEREAYREKNAKATAVWEEKLKDFEQARKTFEKANNALKIMPNGPLRVSEFQKVKELEKIMKQKHKALFV